MKGITQAAHAVTRKNLQLVGVTAMLIASKYEEIWAPEAPTLPPPPPLLAWGAFRVRERARESL